MCSAVVRGPGFHVHCIPQTFAYAYYILAMYCTNTMSIYNSLTIDSGSYYTTD